MNPIIKRQIDVIHELIGQIQSSTQILIDDISRFKSERDKLLQEQWRLKRQASELQQLAANHDTLLKVYQEQQQVLSNLKLKLADLLVKVKRLTEMFYE